MPVVFLFDDPAADLPAGCGNDRVDSSASSSPSAFKQLNDSAI
jgi:hypothetical protein